MYVCITQAAFSGFKTTYWQIKGVSGMNYFLAGPALRGGKGGNCPPPLARARGAPKGPRFGDWRAPQGPRRAPRWGPEGPSFGYFNVFARKTAILTKNDTFGHANEGSPAPREGGPRTRRRGPRRASATAVTLPYNLAPALLFSLMILGEIGFQVDAS